LIFRIYKESRLEELENTHQVMYCSLKLPQSIKEWNGNFVIGTLELLDDIHEIKNILCWTFKYSIMLRPVDWKTDTGVSEDCTAIIFTVKQFMETQLGLFGPQREGTTIPPSSGSNPPIHAA